MASPTEILSAIKNIVNALSELAQAWLNIAGTKRSATISSTTSTLVTTGQGRLASVSVIDCTTNEGAIYDAEVAGATTSQMMTIPALPGIYVVNMPYDNGIVVVLGSGMTAVVSYS